jgi:hypothetical protein
MNDFFWVVLPNYKSLDYGSAIGYNILESPFWRGLSFEDFILLVLVIPFFFYCPDPNILILIGWKSNWLIINTT